MRAELMSAAFFCDALDAHYEGSLYNVLITPEFLQMFCMGGEL